MKKTLRKCQAVVYRHPACFAVERFADFLLVQQRGVLILFHLLANNTNCSWALDGHKHLGAGQRGQSVWFAFVTELIVLG